MPFVLYFQARSGHAGHDRPRVICGSAERGQTAHPGNPRASAPADLSGVRDKNHYTMPWQNIPCLLLFFLAKEGGNGYNIK